MRAHRNRIQLFADAQSASRRDRPRFPQARGDVDRTVRVRIDHDLNAVVRGEFPEAQIRVLRTMPVRRMNEGFTESVAVDFQWRARLGCRFKDVDGAGPRVRVPFPPARAVDIRMGDEREEAASDRPDGGFRKDTQLPRPCEMGRRQPFFA